MLATLLRSVAEKSTQPIWVLMKGSVVREQETRTSINHVRRGRFPKT